MNHKWNILYKSSLIGVIISFLFACQEQLIDGPEKDQPKDGETGMVSFQINLDVPEVETRWGGSMTDNNGSKVENEVQKVRLVLYGQDSGNWIVRYAYDFNIRSRDKDGDGKWDDFEEYYDSDDDKDKKQLYIATVTDHGFITYARPVKWDTYKMLMIINPTSGGTPAYDLYKVTEVGQSLSSFENAVSYSYTTQAEYDQAIKAKENGGPASTTENGTHGYFLMTNHQGLVDVYPDPEKMHIHASEQEANDHPVPVDVSRVVAKVMVQKGSAFSVSPSGASMSNFSWDLDVVNKKTYWMRRMTKLIKDGGGMGDQETQKYDWKVNNNRMALYAEDPNFSQWYEGNKNNLEENFLYRKIEYKDQNNGLSPTLTKRVAGNDAADAAVEYCLENTLDEPVVRPEVTTRVLISGNYVPSGFSAGDSYFMFNNMIIRKRNMIDYAANADKIPAALAGLDEAIQYVKKELNVDFTDAGLSYSFFCGGLAYYQDGISYYTVPIRHTGEEEGTLGEASYGYYGVVRNNYYVIEINNIYGPGTPIIDVDNSGNIAITVEIDKWQNRLQNQVIGW